MCPQTAEHKLFSSIHATFTKTDYILDDKTCLGKFQEIEIL